MHQEKFSFETMTRTAGTLIVLFFVLGQICYGQTSRQPKELKVKGSYVHLPTKTKFPENIGVYQRQDIYSFDQKEENIGSTYKSNQTTLSIYLYPAGDGSEGRLRNEYLQAVQEMQTVSKNDLYFVQKYKCFIKDGYKINGFSAIYTNEPNSKLTLFECGQWFFKIRITTSSLDTAQISVLEKEVLETFQPTLLVKYFPLNSKASIYFAKAAFRDSLMLKSTMSSAFRKLSWAIENVDTLERAAGFPDLYLGLHTESLLELVKFSNGKDWGRKKSTLTYLEEINQIIKAGFLAEFVMEQFSMILIVPNATKLDFAGFKNWKRTNQTKINLNERFYVVSYNAMD